MNYANRLQRLEATAMPSKHFRALIVFGKDAESAIGMEEGKDQSPKFDRRADEAEDAFLARVLAELDWVLVGKVSCSESDLTDTVRSD